jgi:hypothetical protein
MSGYEDPREELNPSAPSVPDADGAAGPRAPEVGKFEAALAALTPRAVSLDRDRLMYLAGQASVGAASARLAHQPPGPSRSGIRENSELNLPAGSDSSRSRLRTAAPHTWRWPVAFSGMSALAATLLVILVARPPRVVERVVHVSVPTPPASDVHLQRPAGESLAASQAVIEQYVIARPASAPAGSDRRPSPPAYLDLRDRVLAMGIESWTTQPNEAGTSNPPETYRELLNEALRGG